MSPPSAEPAGLRLRPAALVGASVPLAVWLLVGDHFLQRVPHLLVALGGPDARIRILAARLVVAAGDVEGQAVIEDHPVAVLGLELGIGLGVALRQRLAGGLAGLDA